MKHTSIVPSACAAAFCLFAYSPLSQAAITVYTSQADFLAVTIDQAVDTFDDFRDDGFVFPPLVRDVGPYTYTAETDLFFFPAQNPDVVRLYASQLDAPITFSNISDEVSAFGAYMFGGNFSGVFEEASSLIITVEDDQGNTFSDSFLADSNTAFFGFTTPGSFTSITVEFDSDSSGYIVVDDVTLAAVPEPSSAMLAAAGLLGLAFHRRRNG